ncbi:AFG1/ZapE family ATPase [Rhodococcoides fascians]|uniref:AFG1/ZapE family ATPase n=1 Tax=Rhodococcoides fascians TaxID=1828 RepID=UPI0035305017
MVQQAPQLTITDIPALASVDDFAAQRFANLVDVLYDRDVRTEFHGVVPLTEFAVGCTGLDTDRLISRLSELGSRSRTSANSRHRPAKQRETPTTDGGRGRQQ